MSGTGCYEHNSLILHHVSTPTHPITLTLTHYTHFYLSSLFLFPGMPEAVPYGRLILDNGRPSPPPSPPPPPLDSALIYLIDLFCAVCDVFVMCFPPLRVSFSDSRLLHPCPPFTPSGSVPRSSGFRLSIVLI